MRVFGAIFIMIILFSACEKEYVYQVGNLPFFEFKKVALSNTNVLDTTGSFFNGIINGISITYADPSSTTVSGGSLEENSKQGNQRYRFVYKLTPTTPQNYQEFPEIYLPSFMTNNINHYVDSLQVGKKFDLNIPNSTSELSNSVSLVMKVPFLVKSQNGTRSEIQVFYSYPEKQLTSNGVKIISKEFKQVGVGKKVVDLTLSVNCILEDYQFNTLEIQDGLFKIRIFI